MVLSRLPLTVHMALSTVYSWSYSTWGVLHDVMQGHCARPHRPLLCMLQVSSLLLAVFLGRPAIRGPCGSLCMAGTVAADQACQANTVAQPGRDSQGGINNQWHVKSITCPACCSMQHVTCSTGYPLSSGSIHHKVQVKRGALHGFMSWAKTGTRCIVQGPSQPRVCIDACQPPHDGPTSVVAALTFCCCWR
jgi:hypothetical protein